MNSIPKKHFLIEKSFNFLINEYHFSIGSSQIESAGPYRLTHICYYNDYIKIEVKYYYEERNLSLIFNPVNFKRYKNNTPLLKKIINESMVYNYLEIAEVYNPKLIKEYNCISMKTEELSIKEKVKFYKTNFDIIAGELIDGNFDVLSNVNKNIELKNSKEMDPGFYNGYVCKKDGKILIINDYDQYKKIIDQQKNETIKKNYLDIINKL